MSTRIGVDYSQPAWSPDGLRLSLAVGQSTENPQIGQIGVMNQAGSGLGALSSAATYTRSSWSPDGQRIVYTSPTGDIVWIKTDGTASDTVIYERMGRRLASL